MDPIYNLGIDIIRSLQSMGGGWYLPMRIASYLAEEYFILAFLPIIYWSISARWGLRLGVYLMLSGSINALTKLFLHGPRPFWLEPSVKAYIFEGSFGIPSNHSQTAVIIFGTLAAWINKTWAWVVAILLIFLVGLSRSYLGVHFPTDVTTGWLLGAILLWLFFHFEKPFLAWFTTKSSVAQVLLSFLTSVLIILLAVLINIGFSGWQIPTAWQENARLAFLDMPITPLTYSSIVTYAAVLFGLSSGFIWLNQRGGYDAGGKVWKRVVRVLIGMIGALILFAGLDRIFPEGDAVIALGFRYLRYCLVGLWVAGLAPILFIRLKLAEKSEAQSS
jgi:membrane-associated phospholipid phosphatase